jgi:glycosyltransferase involved in cell wall biosynthesis
MKQNPGEELLVCGDGEQKKEIKQLIKTKSIDNVKLLGYKSKEELFSLIRDAKATIVPSQWYENCPYSVLESYALGVPVISSKLGGLSEIVKNKKTGLTFRHGQDQDLSSKIKKISQDKELNIRLGEEARKYLKINYSPESHYQKLSRAYKKVLKATKY